MTFAINTNKICFWDDQFCSAVTNSYSPIDPERTFENGALNILCMNLVTFLTGYLPLILALMLAAFFSESTNNAHFIFLYTSIKH